MLRIVIELDLPEDQASQVTRTGLVVNKRGSKHRVEIGGSLIAADKAQVSITQIDDKRGADAAKREDGP